MKSRSENFIGKDTSRARAACVVPYVGAWPHYARLFFESCRHNPGLDVIVVTPEPPRGGLPPNVRVVRMSASEIVQRLESVVGFSLGSFRWHKLCDFRPFFGLAFADLLRSYEFWGYCDIDMMLGNVHRVVDPDHLAGIDAFSAHHKQFVGHFTLLRNRDDINQLGFEIPDWKELCFTEKAEHLDEERLHDVFRSHPELRLDLPENLHQELHKTFCCHAITYTFYGRVADMRTGADEVVTRWQDGKVFVMFPGGEEVEALYVHFMALKHAWHWPRKRQQGRFGTHYFSRLGYGRVRQPEDLRKWFNRCFYGMQSVMLDARKLGGRVARFLLPRDIVRRLRRTLKL